MYKGTHVKKGGRSKVYMSRTTALLIAIVMIAGAAIGSTVAYLVTSTRAVANSFTYAKVSCAVAETVTSDSKSEVKVKNTGSTDAYIRAAYVVNWIDAEGKVLPAAPEGCSYELTPNPDGKWTQGEDGYYYYWTPVAPEESTEGSLVNCRASVPQGSGYKLSVEILATAVQSKPVKAVQEAWGVTPPSGN